MHIAGPEPGFSDFLAAIALIISVLSFWSNRQMASASRSMAETNKTMARASEESARTAREAVQDQRESALRAQKACLHLDRSFYHPRGYFPFEREEEYEDTTGGVTFYLRNEGSAAAVNCSLELDSEALKVMGDTAVRIEPGALGELSSSFPYLQLLNGQPSQDVRVQVSFEDRLGLDRLTFRMVVYPYNDPTQLWRLDLNDSSVEVSELCRPVAIS